MLWRDTEFFNSHPYMTGALLGASIRMEEAIARGERQPRMSRISSGLCRTHGRDYEAFLVSLRPFLAEGPLWAF